MTVRPGSGPPCVDVVVPCYRYGSVLPFAVRSILDQDGVDVRVLVIDDASPDDSADVARSLADADSRVTAVVHRANKGHIATYNEGLLEWAKADYSVLLSADDALTPGALSRATALLEAHPNVGFTYGRPLHWDGSMPPPPARTADRGWIVYSGRRWLGRRFALGNGCITSPEVVVRTALQQDVGGYDPGLPHTGDIEMWMRFAARADVGYLRGVDQAYYRVHGANMSAGYYGDAGILDLEQRLAAYVATVRKVGHLLEDPASHEATVRRVLARTALQRACRAYDRSRLQVEPVEEMIDFARSTVDSIDRLPEWRGLTLRRRLGPGHVTLRPLVVTAAVRWARSRARRERWRLWGV